MKQKLYQKSNKLKQKTVPLRNKNGNKIKKRIYASRRKIPREKFRLTPFDGLLLSSFLLFSGTLQALNTGDNTTRKQKKGGISVAGIREIPEAQKPESAKMLSIKEMNGQIALPGPVYGEAFRKKHTFPAGYLPNNNENFLQKNRSPDSHFNYPGFQSKDAAIIAFYQNLKGLEASLQNQKLKIKQQQLHLYAISTLVFFSFSALALSGLKQKKWQIGSKRNKKAVTSKKLWGTKEKSETVHASFKNEKLRNLYQQVLYLFEVQNIFLDPLLTLNQLAEKLNINEKYVSRAIHQGSGENFPAFINAYRLKETIKIMKDPLYNNLTLEEIRIKSGFYSKSTFISTIKKSTGLAPGKLKKYLQSQKTKDPVSFSYPAFPPINPRPGSAPFQNIQ